jgi:hypothetical protein
MGDIELLGAELLETLLRTDFVEFNASDARMRRMPHTVHFPRFEVLEKRIGGL